jgi:hypothetical protein
LWPQSVAKLVTDGGESFVERAPPWNTPQQPHFFFPSLQASFAAVIFGGYGIAELIASAF